MHSLASDNARGCIMQQKLHFFHPASPKPRFHRPAPQDFSARNQAAHATACGACQCHRRAWVPAFPLAGTGTSQPKGRLAASALASSLRVGDFSCCLKARGRGNKIEYFFLSFIRAAMTRLGVPV